MKTAILLLYILNTSAMNKTELQRSPKSSQLNSHDLPALAHPKPEFMIEMTERATPSTEGSEDTIPTRNHHRRMIYSNSVTALLAICVTSGVTLAIHFSNCKK